MLGGACIIEDHARLSKGSKVRECMVEAGVGGGKICSSDPLPCGPQSSPSYTQ